MEPGRQNQELTMTEITYRVVVADLLNLYSLETRVREIAVIVLDVMLA